MSTEAARITRAGAVATVTLDRPALHNAFDDALIAELTAKLAALDADASVRVVVLAAEGRSFSAGADLNWMRRMAGYSDAENLADARGLAELMRTLDRMSRPTIARVQGSAFGGGVGLVACCDIAVAVPDAKFALTEVRLGLIPAVISPYVVQAIGMRAARRFFLTAERFDAAEAHRLGLVHAVVPAAELDATVASIADALLAGGPQAQAASKALITAVGDRPIDAVVIEDTARRIARQRAGAEGRDGVAAFLDKRPPAWTA
ncbi:MAG: enoyl-CoA hydratase/isomerase family protein [Burkholderiales bacterium]|nr:enoyl-CoA hydratase/isomerase family protein [Burkholderiales bacterium]